MHLFDWSENMKKSFVSKTDRDILHVPHKTQNQGALMGFNTLNACLVGPILSVHYMSFEQN